MVGWKVDFTDERKMNNRRTVRLLILSPFKVHWLIVVQKFGIIRILFFRKRFISDIHSIVEYPVSSCI